MLGVGIWTVADKSYIEVLLRNELYMTMAYVLIVAGVLVVFVSLVGCLGAVKEVTLWKVTDIFQIALLSCGTVCRCIIAPPTLAWPIVHDNGGGCQCGDRPRIVLCAYFLTGHLLTRKHGRLVSRSRAKRTFFSFAIVSELREESVLTKNMEGRSLSATEPNVC